MKVAVYDAHIFDREALEEANRGMHKLRFLSVRLDVSTVDLARDCVAVSCFVNDCADGPTLKALSMLGVKLIALRTAGYNQVDLIQAKELGLVVVRTANYSPYSVAEHAVALMLTLNRKIHKAHNRVREMNFSLDGLVGFDMHGKVIGVVGTGRIGQVFAQIMRGFGCKVIVHDAREDVSWAKQHDVKYVGLEELFKCGDVISLHVPLNPQTRHLVDNRAFALMKNNALLINTGRGALIETPALIAALKRRSIGGACLDVYEEESGVFFNDLSESGIVDDVLARLLTFPNVIITAHQAFLTHEALHDIASATIESFSRFERGEALGDALVVL